VPPSSWQRSWPARPPRPRHPQPITFTALTDKSVGDPAITLTATASSTLAVNFSSLTAATCTVATGKVSPIAIGKCTVAADQPGNANYAAAPRVEQSFNVAKACTPVILNGGLLTTWTLKRVITGGSAAYSPLEVVLTGLTGSNVDSTDSIKVDSTGTITACPNYVTFTLTLSQGGSPRGVLMLTGTISSAANQSISGDFKSTDILNTTTGLFEVGTFTMTHN
jgi:hypothetical protein